MVCETETKDEINKINIKDKKILFLGCGAVSKCCLSYLKQYFNFDYVNVIIVDKSSKEKDFPIVDHYLKQNSTFIVKEVDKNNYKDLFDSFQLKEKDIVIDLTTRTPTFEFFTYCRLNNLFYTNSSSEQSFAKDHRFESMILQHYNYMDIVRKTPHCNNVTTLIEYAINPGLISSFTLKGIDDIANYFINKNEMNNTIDEELIKLYKLKSKDRYSLLAKKLKIRVIHCSEIDTQVVTSNTLSKDKYYNTWSYIGLIDESYQGIELAVGTHEKEIPLEKHEVYINGIFSSSTMCKDVKVKSIVPLNLDVNNKVVFTEIEGYPIHHGECCSLYRFLSLHDYSPTMHYVYKLNPYAEDFIVKNKNDTNLIEASYDSNAWEVLNLHNHQIDGYDNVGALFILDETEHDTHDTCGETSCKNKFTWWCGTILSNEYAQNILNDNLNSATLIQAMYGVLGGVYWSLLPENQNKGLCFGEDVDYKLVLSINEKLLGKIYSGKTDGANVNSFYLKDLIL
jgi:homospermidine synthase